MNNRIKCIIILLLTFLLYGNTLFHDYTLDDAIVIYENEFTLNGFNGIKSILSEDSFNGFFEEKNKKLVSGGRYRPFSIVTFAVEWQLFMGSPFKGVNELTLKRRMNKGANPKLILPSQKLLKELSNTIYTGNKDLRQRLQKNLLKNTNVLTGQEQAVILSNLERMYNRKGLVLFVSHFINVLLFALTGLVLFILLEMLFCNFQEKNWYLSIPFLATLIFIAHPIHTEVVANIKGRDEILSLLGALLAMYFIFKYFDKKKAIFLVTSFIFFLMGLFSKEVAITFLAIVPLSIYFFKGEKDLIKKIIISLVPLTLASIFYFIVRKNVLGDISFEPSSELMNNSFLGMNFSEKYATIFYTLLLYIRLLIFLHPLTYDYYPYHIPMMNWNNILPILSVCIYLFLGIYALLGLKKKSIVSFGILFYIIALSPTSNILFPIGVFMNERFVYAASVGFVIVLAYLLSNKIPQWLINKNQSKKLVITVISIILVLFSVKTISRNRVWKNDFTLFTHDVKISSNSAKSNTSAGGKLIEEAIKPGNKNVRNDYLKQAIFYLNRAIQIYPEYNDALLLMGNAQWELYENIDSTFKYYGRILKSIPTFDNVYSNIFETKMGKVFDDASKANQNISILHQLEKYNPNHFKVNYNLGRIYGRYLNNLEMSKKYLEKASRINSKDIAVFKDLGVVYGITKDYEKSALALKKASELDPQDPVLKVNLAMTYANLRNFDDALKVMDSAIEMDFKQKDASALVNLGYLYRNLQKPQKAQQCFAKAREINPELFKK